MPKVKVPSYEQPLEMTPTYEITGESITCLECGMTSWNGNDVLHRYCGNCHEFHDHKASRRLLLDSYFAEMVSELEKEMEKLCSEEERRGRGV